MDVSGLNIELAKTLEAAAVVLNRGGQKWVVFGGAAMALHGYDVGVVSDVDILVSAETATWLMKELAVENQADGQTSQSDEYDFPASPSVISFCDCERLLQSGFLAGQTNRFHYHPTAEVRSPCGLGVGCGFRYPNWWKSRGISLQHPLFDAVPPGHANRIDTSLTKAALAGCFRAKLFDDSVLGVQPSLKSGGRRP